MSSGSSISGNGGQSILSSGSSESGAGGDLGIVSGSGSTTSGSIATRVGESKGLGESLKISGGSTLGDNVGGSVSMIFGSSIENTSEDIMVMSSDGGEKSGSVYVGSGSSVDNSGSLFLGSGSSARSSGGPVSISVGSGMSDT